MAQDIRELLKQDRQIPVERIREGHKQRFKLRLEKELPKKTTTFTYNWLKVAASIIVIFSVSMLAYTKLGSTNAQVDQLVENSTVKNATVTMNKQSSTLAEISPEYEEVENTILTSIKFQLSSIKVNDTNRELVESFKTRLDNLDKEYQRLNTELIQVGPNVQSVEAMMENLTIRLSLLSRLKDKLKELESIENEIYNEVQA
ncbi:hypothetical protein J8281_18555 [Aquimarina sp. U1-2]|uniref:hypothetical protein n=1 Tax=Aquimarina sp. U1-2 TaxID=2823141 RepID=UPI001AECC37B|nr:hypothetical protein [Aquimarina sp. U1-2]MBP2834205.1 hypothetical protein [Aquimarina sp. U1-2]